MKLLERYLWLPWWGTAWIATLAISGGLLALTVGDSMRWVHGKDLGSVVEWIALMWPMAFVRVLPVAFLLITALTAGRLVSTRATAAMSAGGVSPGRALAPWWPTLLFVALVSLAMSEWVVPVSERRGTELWWSLNTGRDAAHRLTGQVLWLPEGVTLHFDRFLDDDGLLSQVRVQRVRGDVVEVWRAERAVWRDARLTLFDADYVQIDVAALDLPPETALEDRMYALLPEVESAEAVDVVLAESRSETQARYSGGTVGDGRSLSRHVQVSRDATMPYVERLESALRAHEILVAALSPLLLSAAVAVWVLRRSSRPAGAMSLAALLGVSWLLLTAVGRITVQAGVLAPWAGAWMAPIVVVTITGLAIVRWSEWWDRMVMSRP